MSIFNNIRAACENHLITATGLPTLAFQNVLNNPTVGSSFIKATFLPITARAAVRGLNPSLRYDALFNLLVCTPEGEGSGLGYQYADTLMTRFRATTDISFGGYIISVDYSEIGNSYLSPPFYCTPVSVAVYIYN